MMNHADSRLAAAVAASRSWYDDVMALHAVPVTATDELWVAHGPVPPFHSTVLALRPALDADTVAEAIRNRRRSGLAYGSVADCFADIDLAARGFEKLFEARWIHRPAPEPGPAAGWRVLAGPPDLLAWSELHGYVGVLPDDVLAHPRFRVLARWTDGRIVGGAVTHQPGNGDVVGLSNVWQRPGTDPDWPGLLATVGRLHPRQAVVGYERDADLARALAAGFAAVGTHRVWVPSS